MQEQTATGLRMFQEKLEATGKLTLEEHRRFSDRRAYHLVIAFGQKKVDIVLTENFLSDLPATREYQAAVDEYVGWLINRMENLSPLDFYCKSGIPLRVEIQWPFEPVPNRAAAFVHVYVHDIRFALVAKCSVIRTWQSEKTQDPFQREKAIVNRIRRGVDRQELTFYVEAAHPTELQQVELSGKEQASRSSQTEVEQYVAGKVYWLAFKPGEKRTKVWIADPWDAEYLGVEPKSLFQAAQILEARRVITLEPKGEFASAGEGLLLRAEKFELTPSDKAEEVSRQLKEKGVVSNCPRCGTNDWHADLLGYLVSGLPLTEFTVPRAHVPVLNLTCKKCGAMQLHNLNIIGIKL